MSDIVELAGEFQAADELVEELQKQLEQELERRRLAREALLDATQRLAEDYD